MKKELDDVLCSDFPKLFRDRKNRQSMMFFGFPGDGWEPIIRECEVKIEALNDKVNEPDAWVVASQVKEKFGTLRLYINGGLSEYAAEVDAAIDEAEKKSAEICEECGKPGKLIVMADGWMRTACSDH